MITKEDLPALTKLDARGLFSYCDRKERIKWIDKYFNQTSNRVEITRNKAEAVIMNMDYFEFQDVKKLKLFDIYKFFNKVK